MSEKYDLIFSLGSIPLVSQLLRECDLQFFDFPFDNLAGSDFYTRMNLFIDNCNNFLNEYDIRFEENAQEEQITVKNSNNNLIYPKEDFNPNLPVENSFPSVKYKYDKLIKTLYLCIRNARKILIVYTENPTIQEDDTETSVLIGQSIDLLKKKYPNKEFHIIYIRNEDNSQDIQAIQIGQHAEKLKFYFYKKFSQLSSAYIDLEMLKIALTDLKLKTTFTQSKILWAQKIIRILQSFVNIKSS